MVSDERLRVFTEIIYDPEMKDAATELLARREAMSAMLKALRASSHALNSYKYGNASTELAEKIIPHIDAAIALAERCEVEEEL